jgi:hypothetical protein
MVSMDSLIGSMGKHKLEALDVDGILGGGAVGEYGGGASCSCLKDSS